ncbi:hypothetical protein [Simkania sp.]|uniref:hypothetical protein n=1 Tax=Simkania sp. TaxID=34094 RepID=UPI003B52014C
MPIIHLLGDSTLDNRIWVPKAEDAIPAQIKALCQEDGYQLINHAYDGFTTEDVLNGGYIGAVLQKIEGFLTYMSEKGAALGDKAYPLQTLENAINEAPDDVHYVVLSVCGNDFRIRLNKPFAVFGEFFKVQKRYLKILDKIQATKGKNIRPILMLQYLTCPQGDPHEVYTAMDVLGVLTFTTHIGCLVLLTMPLWLLFGKVTALAAGVCFVVGATVLYFAQKIIPFSITKGILTGKKAGMVMFTKLLSVFYQPILKRAKKDKLPVLDLSNTFNPYKDLYNSGIEPNAKGSKLIAEGINHVVKQHDFNDESMLYSKTDENESYQGKKNDKPQDWKVAYPASKT